MNLRQNKSRKPLALGWLCPQESGRSANGAEYDSQGKRAAPTARNMTARGKRAAPTARNMTARGKRAARRPW